MNPAQFTTQVNAIVEQAERPALPTCAEDTLNHRVVIRFQVMPDADTCAAMKRAGFKYRGGSTAAWVRPLTANGRAAAARVMEKLRCPPPPQPAPVS